MRWFWIDRFTAFERGRRAAAIRTVTVNSDYVDGYFPNYPVLSPAFVLEGFAQMGGLLISEPSGFRCNLVLAKVSRCRILKYPRPGDCLNYEVTLENLQTEGGFVRASSQLDGQLQAEAELTFAQVGRAIIDRDFFEPVGLLRMLRIYRLYDVGVDQDGRPLAVPQHLLDAERASLGR
jgi:3-hydroxymyristoyl/3-hydroxydecanoyl-(acyl carrier protein) dehydratase